MVYYTDSTTHQSIQLCRQCYNHGDVLLQSAQQCKVCTLMNDDKCIICEVCVDNIRSFEVVRVLFDNFIDSRILLRVELCSNIDINGGYTPSITLMNQVNQTLYGNKSNIPIHTLIREDTNMRYGSIPPYNLDGIYCDGVVLGGLNNDMTLDINTMHCHDQYAMTVHRCIDCTPDIIQSTKLLIDGVSANCVDPYKTNTRYRANYILSSGGASTATDGLSTIKQMNELVANTGVHIIAAGGINDSNVKHIMNFTGIHCIHGSFRDDVDTDVPINRIKSPLAALFGINITTRYKQTSSQILLNVLEQIKQTDYYQQYMSCQSITSYSTLHSTCATVAGVVVDQ